jgi:uncharacterized membrane protein YesL
MMMKDNNYKSIIHSCCDWIMHFMYLNILWLAFTIIGGVILGFFPASIAMVTVTRKWVAGERDISIFQIFWLSYRKHFWKKQQLGLTLMVIALILYFSINFYLLQDEFYFGIAYYVSLLLIIIYSMTILYIFPLIAGSFDSQVFKCLKIAFTMAITHILHSITTIVGIFVIISLFFLLPKLILFFCGSSIAFWLSWQSQQLFNKMKLVEI